MDKNDNYSDEMTYVAALVVTTIVGVSFLLLLPVIVAAIVESRNLSTLEVGFFSAADMFGAALSAFAFGSFVNRSNARRLVAAAALTITVTNIACAYTQQLPILLLLRFTSGVFAGFLLAVGNTGLATSRQAVRNIALYTVSALLLGAVGISVFSQIAEAAGDRGIFFGLAGIAAAGVFASLGIPTRIGQTNESGVGHTKMQTPLVVSSWIPRLGIIGVSLYFLSLGILWANFKVIGLAANLGENVVDSAISASLIAGMVGGISALLLGTRLGRLWPVSVSVFGSALSILLLFSVTAPSFLVAACVLIFGWNFTYPFQISAIAAADPENRYVPRCVGLMFLGFSVGPVIAAGLLNLANGVETIKLFALFGLAVSIACLAPVLRYRADGQEGKPE